MGRLDNNGARGSAGGKARIVADRRTTPGLRGLRVVRGVAALGQNPRLAAARRSEQQRIE